MAKPKNQSKLYSVQLLWSDLLNNVKHIYTAIGKPNVVCVDTCRRAPVAETHPRYFILAYTVYSIYFCVNFRFFRRCCCYTTVTITNVLHRLSFFSRQAESVSSASSFWWAGNEERTGASRTGTVKQPTGSLSVQAYYPCNIAMPHAAIGVVALDTPLFPSDTVAQRLTNTTPVYNI